MAHLSIIKKHQLSLSEARKAAEAVTEDLKARFELECRWEGNVVRFERSGLSGALTVGADSVRLDCQLGFLFSALKGSIEREVHKEFDKRFGVA
ncbi:MAG: polyhydroxyalkanoic acid system family protein [Pseudomonadota bacterium]|nr:polyhydroxyalkanoic acid system family protein [Pseudomonadota bacterium]